MLSPLDIKKLFVALEFLWVSDIEFMKVHLQIFALILKGSINYIAYFIYYAVLFYSFAICKLGIFLFSDSLQVRKVGDKCHSRICFFSVYLCVKWEIKSLI